MISENNKMVLNGCSYDDSIEYLNTFSHSSMIKLLPSACKSKEAKEFIRIESIPFFFIKKLCNAFKHTATYPYILNKMISELIPKERIKHIEYY